VLKQAEEQVVGERSPKRRLRMGLVGCGEVTQIMHWSSLYQLSDHFEVTALCDVSPLILEELGKLWNVGALTTNHRELMARNDVDAILVANPNAFHAEVTLDAIAAGKHVLVEKPMCVTRREADEIIAAQKDSNVVVQVGYMRRYAPAFLDGCEAVKAMKEIKFARVRDVLGFNYLFVNPTSRVIRDEQLPESVKNDTKLRDEALVEEALGEKASPVLRRAYAVMLGLSSHDLSAMRESRCSEATVCTWPRPSITGRSSVSSKPASTELRVSTLISRSTEVKRWSGYNTIRPTFGIRRSGSSLRKITDAAG
jgi:Oxidoreductase family, NAD-binding Rossmann fold